MGVLGLCVCGCSGWREAEALGLFLVPLEHTAAVVGGGGVSAFGATRLDPLVMTGHDLLRGLPFLGIWVFFGYEWLAVSFKALNLPSISNLTYGQLSVFHP